MCICNKLLLLKKKKSPLFYSSYPFFPFSQLCGCQCPQVFLRDVAGDNRTTGFLTRERWLANCYPLTGVCAWLWEANTAAICSPWRNPSPKIMTFAEIFRDLTTLLKHGSWAPKEPDKKGAFKLLETVILCFLPTRFVEVLSWFSLHWTPPSPEPARTRQIQGPGECCLLLGFKTCSPWKN